MTPGTYGLQNRAVILLVCGTGVSLLLFLRGRAHLVQGGEEIGRPEHKNSMVGGDNRHC